MNYPKIIEIVIPEGSLSGVIHNSRQHLTNWLDSHRVADTVRTTLALISHQMLFPIACLNNIEVDEDSRGMGIGSCLMDMFFDIIDGEAVTAILEVDTGQEQTPGFDLESWYSGYGFLNISGESSYPIMLWTADS